MSGDPQADEHAGTCAVITGGASGIGEATVRAFVARGAHVVVVDVDADRLSALAGALGPAVTPVRADVSRAEDCAAVAAAAQGTGLPVRALVNAAASFVLEAENATPAEWDISLATNVKGPALMAAAVLPLLRAAGGGAIVNIASVSGHVAQSSRWTYSATKGAILALTRCQALDLAGDGIRVNSVSPGTIATPILDRVMDGDRETWGPVLGRHHILNRVGEPHEVADAIVFLCGPRASFVTGADLPVDGGYLAMGHDRISGP